MTKSIDSETNPETLKRFLNNVFPDPLELVRWASDLSPNNGVKIIDKLSPHVSNEELAHQLIKTLESLGRIDAEFFTRLSKALPSRKAEILQHARDWDITLMDAAPREDAPRPTNDHRVAYASVALCLASALVASIPVLDGNPGRTGDAANDWLARSLRGAEQKCVEKNTPDSPAPDAVPLLPPAIEPLPRPKHPSAQTVKQTSNVHRPGPHERSTALVATLKDVPPGKYTVNMQFKGDLGAGSTSVSIEAALRLCHHPAGKKTVLSSLDCLPDHKQRSIELSGGTNMIDSVPFEIPKVAGVEWVVVFELGEHSEVVQFDLTPKKVEILA